MFRATLVFLLFIILIPTQAQEYKPLRIEYGIKQFDMLRLIPAHPKKVIAFKHFTKSNSKGEVWQVDGLNEGLKVVWTKDIIVPRMFQLREYEVSNDSILHLLAVKNGGESASFLKIRLNIINGNYTSHYFKGNRRSLLVGLKMYNNKLYLYGVGLDYIQDQIDNYNKETSFEKVISTNVPEEYKIISALADTALNRFVMIVKNTKNSQGEIRLLEFNDKGVITKTKLLGQTDNRNILDGNLVYSEDSELLFIGTYNNHTTRKKKGEDNNAYGVFIGKITESQFDFFQFYRFTDFQNIYKTLSFSEQQKIKNDKGKERYVELSFKLLMHNKILKQNGQYILVAESYYPVYHYETMYDGRGYMYQTEVFDGYSTTYAIAASFDGEGKLLWDNYMKVTGVSSYFLDENITVYNDDDTQVFMYYLDESIHSKVTKGNETVFKLESSKIQTVSEKDQVLAEDYGRIAHWHSSYFLISGYQKISNLGEKSRKVYFITGVSFE